MDSTVISFATASKNRRLKSEEKKIMKKIKDAQIEINRMQHRLSEINTQTDYTDADILREQIKAKENALIKLIFLLNKDSLNQERRIILDNANKLLHEVDSEYEMVGSPDVLHSTGGAKRSGKVKKKNRSSKSSKSSKSRKSKNK